MTIQARKERIEIHNRSEDKEWLQYQRAKSYKSFNDVFVRNILYILELQPMASGAVLMAHTPQTLPPSWKHAWLGSTVNICQLRPIHTKTQYNHHIVIIHAQSVRLLCTSCSSLGSKFTPKIR